MCLPALATTSLPKLYHETAGCANLTQGPAAYPSFRKLCPVRPERAPGRVAKSRVGHRRVDLHVAAWNPAAPSTTSNCVLGSLPPGHPRSVAPADGLKAHGHCSSTDTLHLWYPDPYPSPASVQITPVVPISRKSRAYSEPHCLHLDPVRCRYPTRRRSYHPRRSSKLTSASSASSIHRVTTSRTTLCNCPFSFSKHACLVASRSICSRSAIVRPALARCSVAGPTTRRPKPGTGHRAARSGLRE